MKFIHRLILVIGLAFLVAACGRGDALEIPAGSEVTVQKRDGVEIRGTLVAVEPGMVVVDAAGKRTSIPRADIRAISALSLSAAAEPTVERGEPADTVASEADGQHDDTARNLIARMLDRGPEYREVTIPSGTLLPAALQTAVASDASSNQEAVRATLRRPVVIDGAAVLPAGTTLHGAIVRAERSGRVKGRASVSFRFSRIDTPEGGRVNFASAPITRVATGTKKKDAATIGVGAAGGAIVGGLLGGGEGAAKGAAAGGAAGTGVVLSTRGEEVRLASGTPISVRLTAPLRVRVPVER